MARVNAVNATACAVRAPLSRYCFSLAVDGSPCCCELRVVFFYPFSSSSASNFDCSARTLTILLRRRFGCRPRRPRRRVGVSIH